MYSGSCKKWLTNIRWDAPPCATLRHCCQASSTMRAAGYFDGANPVHGVEIPKARPAGETHAYTLEQVIQIVTALPQPSATITATAAFTGLRRGEIEGLVWGNYDGKELRVTRSVWYGHVDEPKTPRAKLRCRSSPRCEKCWMPIGKHTAPGVRCHVRQLGRQAAMLNNLTNRCIQPRFEYCKHCGRSRADHGNGHEFERDERRIVWRGGMPSAVGSQPTCTVWACRTR